LENPAWRALRDWRVWALFLTIQGPGVRAVVRYAPWPAAVLFLLSIVSIAIYSVCLHGSFARWTHGAGSRVNGVAAVLCLVAAVNLAAYPRVDALKRQGRGSDEDNAIIDTAQRLVTLKRPLYVPTYLGNAPSIGPGWAAVVAAVSGAVCALALLDDRIDSWWLGMWAVLAFPLTAVAVEVLGALNWEFSTWQAAGYVEVAVPALVAYVALPQRRNAS
jgi:hypothetical protein